MVAGLGVNLDYANVGEFDRRASGRPHPEDLLLFEWVRLVPRDDAGFGEYVETLQATGRRVMLALDGDALGMDPAGWAGHAAAWADVVSPDCWQIGNEPDGTGPTSWRLDPPVYAQLLGACLPEIRARQPSTTVITAGLCSGDPSYLDRFGWPEFVSELDGVAVHPYGQQPGPPPWPEPFPSIQAERPVWCPFGTVDNLLRSYAAHLGPGQRLWISEFGDRTAELPEEYHRRISRRPSSTGTTSRPRWSTPGPTRMNGDPSGGFGLVDFDGNDKLYFRALQSLGRSAPPQPRRREPPPPFSDYVVRTGDSLSAIAAAHGFSLAEILAVNPQITNPALIHPGQIIHIPPCPSAPSIGSCPFTGTGCALTLAMGQRSPTLVGRARCPVLVTS